MRRRGSPAFTIAAMTERQRYLDIELPERLELQFWNEDTQSWWGEVICLARHFSRDENGTYINTMGGSALWFRCVEYLEDGSFIHIDGGGHGRRHRYRLPPLPMINE